MRENRVVLAVSLLKVLAGMAARMSMNPVVDSTDNSILITERLGTIRVVNETGVGVSIPLLAILRFLLCSSLVFLQCFLFSGGKLLFLSLLLG